LTAASAEGRSDEARRGAGGGAGAGRRALVVGAGLAGCLLAVYLARDGWKVALRERRGDPRQAGAGGGRSINLAISARGIHALDRAGLTGELLANGLRMPGRMIHPVAGTPTFQPYSSDPPSPAPTTITRCGMGNSPRQEIEARARAARHTSRNPL